MFMYDHTLNLEKKHICHYSIHALSKEEILINGKQKIVMPKKGKYIKFKNYERKIKSAFMIYADFESILVPENNGH